LMIVVMCFFLTHAEAGEIRLRLGTGSIGGTDNVSIEAMSAVVNRHTQLRTSTVTTTGAIEIIHLIQTGELEAGYTGSINLVQAIRGEAPFRGVVPFEALLQGFGFVSWKLPILTVKGSGIQSYLDLKGRKVAFPDVGSASTEVLKIVFEQFGILNDARIENFTWNEGFSALKDGRVEACVGTWGNKFPPAGIIDLMTTREIVPLSLTPEVGAKIHEVNSGIMAQEMGPDECNTIPEGTTILVPVNAGIMIFSANLAEDTVYQFVKACIDNIEELGRINNNLVELKNYLTSVCVKEVPFHPGAVKALKEAGLWDDSFTIYKK